MKDRENNIFLSNFFDLSLGTFEGMMFNTMESTCDITEGKMEKMGPYDIIELLHLVYGGSFLQSCYAGDSAGEAMIQGQPRLCSTFQASLGYRVRSYIKKPRELER